MKNYSMMNLSRSQMVEDLCYTDRAAATSRCYNDLEGRNQVIRGCISQYYRRAKSELNLKV
jgi:hypothetical protein